MGYDDDELWQCLHKQIQSRKPENFIVEWVKNENFLQGFDYIGEKGGYAVRNKGEMAG